MTSEQLTYNVSGVVSASNAHLEKSHVYLQEDDVNLVGDVRE